VVSHPLSVSLIVVVVIFLYRYVLVLWRRYRREREMREAVDLMGPILGEGAGEVWST
jgi:hypothetical protein